MPFGSRGSGREGKGSTIQEMVVAVRDRCRGLWTNVRIAKSRECFPGHQLEFKGQEKVVAVWRDRDPLRPWRVRVETPSTSLKRTRGGAVATAEGRHRRIRGAALAASSFFQRSPRRRAENSPRHGNLRLVFHRLTFVSSGRQGRHRRFVIDVCETAGKKK